MNSKIIALALVTGCITTVAAESSTLASIGTEHVVAGRNLRNGNTHICRITINSDIARLASSARAVITLPEGARLLDARVTSPARVQSSCQRVSVSSEGNQVSCRLTRITPNQDITLLARYRKSLPTESVCSGYINSGG